MSAIARELVPRAVPRALRRRRLLEAIGEHAAMVAIATMFMAPILFIVLTSLMTDRQALTSSIWPSPIRWENFATVLETIPFFRYTFNTFTIAFVATIGVVLSSVPVAYALSRIDWKGRQAAFLVILATLMLPFQVTVVPLYVLFVNYGWIPSFKPLIVPAFFGDAFSIFLLRQFFMSIPTELSDAARVDGASEWQIMTRVIVPLARPAIAAIALFNFLYNWNDFFGPLLYLTDNPDLWTLAIGLNEFKSIHHVEWNLVMASSAMFMLPVIVLFFLAQRVFIEGVTLTGVKG
ncbi:MAG: carbohydrate ABC transporter permease [Actinomycetota bacterium]